MQPRLPIALLASLLALAGCDGENRGPPDAGGMDASARDAGRDAGSLADAATVQDAGRDAATPPEDGGPMCAPGEHLCGATCTAAMANMPENGCRLGCGDACPGGAEAICHPDGTCGIRGCTPMTCEALSVMCGTTDDGCGRRIACGTCTAPLRCETGRCVCDGDPLEANDTSTSASALTALTDEPDSSVTVTTGTIHTATDVDWYRASVMNNCCFGDPVITVSLRGIPAGEDYDLGAWYQCPDGDAPSCSMGMADASVASGGCVASAVGADTVSFATNCNSHGVLFVRVNAFSWAGSCAPYQLEVSVR